MRFEIRKRIKFIWNKEELPKNWQDENHTTSISRVQPSEKLVTTYHTTRRQNYQGHSSNNHCRKKLVTREYYFEYLEPRQLSL